MESLYPRLKREVQASIRSDAMIQKRRKNNIFLL
jgi:hypothetical protein